MHYIYLTTNLINNKKYIGQRLIQPNGIDKDNYLGSGTALLNAVRKYGTKNFKKDILYICKDYEQADFLERLEIQKRNAVDSEMYYNIQDGGLMNRSKKYAQIVSKTMFDYYSNDDNYIKTIQKLNRKRYLQGLKPIEITTIAQRDINKLKRRLIIENTKKNRIEKNEVLKLIRNTYIVRKTDEELKETRSNASKKIWQNESFRNTVVNKLSAKNKERAKYAIDNNIPLFEDNHKMLLSKAKLEKSNNYFGLYLLELGILNLKLIQKSLYKINTNDYKDNNNALNQLKNVLNKVFEYYSITVCESKALELINKSRELNCKYLIINEVL